MNLARVTSKIICTAFVILCPYFNSSAQLGLLDDVIKAAAQASKAKKIAGGGRIIKYADQIGDLKVPITAASREKLNIPLYDVAFDNIHGVDEAGKARIYLGMEGDQLTFVTDMAKDSYSDDLFLSGSYDEYGSYLRQHDLYGNADYIVEADILENPFYHDLLDFANKRIYLSNFDGRPWRVRNVIGRGELAIEIKPGLFCDINEASLGEIMPLLDLPFSKNDIKIVSLFDESSDGRTIDAIKDAVGTSVPYNNVRDNHRLNAFINAEKGKVIAIVGHVEDKDFVIRNALDEEVARISIEGLQLIAAKKKSSLLFLGCEAGKIRGVPGPIEKINSLAVAAQLKDAVKSENYGDFFASIASGDSPFILTGEIINNAHQLAARRIGENNRIIGASVSTIVLPSKLTKPQLAVSSQLFKTLPAWLDTILVLVIFLIVISIPLALIISLLSFSLKPIVFTFGAIYTVISLPFIGVIRLYKRATKAKANPDRVY